MKQFSADVEWWDIGKILPYLTNNKKHPDEQIAKIAASMAEFGVDVPVVVDADGVLIKGHGRRLAALKLGLTKLPVIVRSDLTRAQVKAARIADNRVAQSDYDMDSLLVELQQLDELGVDLSLTGFDQDELDAMFNGEGEDALGSEEPAAVDDGDRFLLLLEFESEEKQQAMFAEMQDRGVECKIMN